MESIRPDFNSCKLYNDKYMVASTQIANTETFAFIAFLVFMLFNRKVLFLNRKKIDIIKK